MIRSLLLVGALISCLASTQAQMLPLDIPVAINGRTLKYPWTGGMNLPQFSPLDLNNDGIQDLVVFDRYGEVASTFINRGTPNQVDYEYSPRYMSYLPQMEGRNFMLFRDFNCDGAADIFGMYEMPGAGLVVAVWEGSYLRDTIRYTRIIDRVTYDASAQGLSATSGMFIYNTDLPAIGDADGDGDTDILAFTLDICFPTNVFYYKNMSAENGHGCDSLQFRLESECWGLFSESGDSSKVNFGPSTDSCYRNPWFNALPRMRPQGQGGTRSGGRHVGANTTMIDFNGDGHLDMALGSVSYNNVNMIHGTTINDTVLITNQDYHYPSYDKPVNIYSFPSTYFMDVNNDGKLDFLAAPSERGIGQAVMDSVAWYYENVGSNSNMLFDFQQKDFLVGDMIDVGEHAYPVLFDYDVDGDLDLLVGGRGRVQATGGYEYGLSLWQNIGTTANPRYELVTMNYANTNALQVTGLYPAVGDLDGDGDLDMICGAQDGTLWFFKNNAAAGAPAAFGPPSSNYAGIDVGDASTPQLVDFDRDGVLDLIIGSFSGPIHYFENLGTANAANFSNTPTVSNLGGYNIAQSYSRNSMPYMHDNAGIWEFFIGHRDGNIIHLGNINNNLFGTYDTLSEHYNDIYYGAYSKPSAMVDINNDGKLEFLIGTGHGGAMFLYKADPVMSTATLAASAAQGAYLYPNPANDQVMIRLETAPTQPIQVTFYNALGQPLLQRTISDQQQYLDIRALPAGILLVELRAGDYQETVRLVKQ